MPYRLSAFADEVSTDIQIQMDHLLENNIHWCALRSANGRAVADLEDFQIKLTKEQFHHRGIKFSCIASTVGATALSDPFENELTKLKKAAELARTFETKVIRIDSFLKPQSDTTQSVPPEVLQRLKALADLAKAESVNLEMCNVSDSYGSTPENMLEILTHLTSPNVRLGFDFGHFVSAGVDPLNAWTQLKKSVVDIHVNDQIKGQAINAKCVGLGQGEGRVKEVLQEAISPNSGWSGYLTLAPRLGAQTSYGWTSGPAAFKSAATELKKWTSSV